MQTTTTNGKTIFELGVAELHRVSTDDSARKAVEHDFNEARGREQARLHVTLKAITETDARAAENARVTLEAIERLTADLADRAQKLSHLIESFEQVAEKRFNGAQDQVNNFWQAETGHFDALKAQVGETRTTLAAQGDASTDRIAHDLRSLRDEIVRLVDSRMNQSDAAFAAVRGDVEVVKFLVMDIIKDRIGRSDPKAKPF